MLTLAPPTQQDDEEDVAPAPAAPKPKPPVAPVAAPVGAAPAAPPKPASLGLAPMTAPAMTPPPIPAPTIAAPAAPVDRVKLATDVFDASAESTRPAYEAAQRDAVRRGAALGQIGSGGLRTSVGNLQLARERDLDLMRRDLVNKATEGSIADATTAFQQGLAGSQQALAGELGRGNLDVARTSADTARLGTAGGLALEEKRLDQSGGQFEKSLDFQKEQARINAEFAAGRLTLEQKDQQLRELSNQQQFGLAGEQLGLAKEQFALSKQLGLEGLTLDQARAKLDEDVRRGSLTLAQRDAALREKESEQANRLNVANVTGYYDSPTAGGSGSTLEAQRLQLAREGQTDSLALQRAALELDEKVRTGQMTLAERDQKLRELANTQQNRLAVADRTGFYDDPNPDGAQSGITLEARQVAEQAKQFGASQAQQLELAKLADATQNRQIDVSTAQGKNALLLELARIMGGPNGNVDPSFIQTLAAALGVSVGGPSGVGSQSGSPVTTQQPSTLPGNASFEEFEADYRRRTNDLTRDGALAAYEQFKNRPIGLAPTELG